jgi:hypothetical protein
MNVLVQIRIISIFDGEDRKGRTLTNVDIEHYQKIIVALTETERIMGEVDKVC